MGEYTLFEIFDSAGIVSTKYEYATCRYRKRVFNADKKYYHINSIENFILNLHLIKPESKELVINSLESCIKYYKENSITDVRHSLKIFNLHLKSIGKIYEEQASFFILIKPWILTTLVLLPNLLIYFLNVNMIFTIMFNFSILGIIIYLAIKYQKHKLYAFLW
ncbi:MAG: hypothetical protein V4556_04260 [Bacteroidota bacterium]